jgi:CspA family cold shock protein
MRRRGTVREWHCTHGFIEWPGGAVFVHFTNIKAQGHRSLIVGSEVEFEIEEGTRGFHAVRVIAVTDSSAQLKP